MTKQKKIQKSEKTLHKWWSLYEIEKKTETETFPFFVFEDFYLDLKSDFEGAFWDCVGFENEKT